MEAKHTPGPWCIDPHQSPEQPLTVFDGPNCGTLIAIVSGDPDEPENEANAKLIAAAPDLLAALERIAAIKVTGYDGDYGIQAIADAAIAKATGTQSRLLR
jgi:hypothetical protein